MEKQKEAEDKDMNKVMSTSIGTVTQVSINFRENQKEHKKMVTEHNTKHTYEYGDKCVNMEEEGNVFECFNYTYAGIRKTKM